MSSCEDNAAMVKLKSNDGQLFEVEKKMATLSTTVKNMIEDLDSSDGDWEVIPIHNADGETLENVLEYCKFHADDPSPDPSADAGQDGRDAAGTAEKANRKAWDDEFIGQFGIRNLFNLISAASFMDIKGLLDLAAQAAADFIKDKTVEEVRDIFDVENDYTEEEEAEFHRQNAWAFEIP